MIVEIFNVWIKDDEQFKDETKGFTVCSKTVQGFELRQLYENFLRFVIKRKRCSFVLVVKVVIHYATGDARIVASTDMRRNETRGDRIMKFWFNYLTIEDRDYPDFRIMCENMMLGQDA